MKSKSILLIFIVLILYSVPSSASITIWSDTFEDAGWIASYTPTGSWGRTTPSLDGTNYVYSTSGTSTLTKTGLTGTQSQWTIDIVAAGSSYVGFNFSSDGSVNDNGFYVGSDLVLRGKGFSYTPYTLTSLAWYRLVVNLTGSAYNVKVYNSALTLVNEQNPTITTVVASPNQIFLQALGAGKIDNVFVGTLTHSMSGYVNETSGAVINGATVSYSGGSASTNAAGFYSFSSIIDGTYTFTASKNGFTSSSQSIAVTSDKTNQNFTLVNTSVTSTNISWASTSYTVGDIANLSWNIKDDIWTFYNGFTWSLSSTDLNGNTKYWKSDGTESLVRIRYTIGTQTGYYRPRLTEPGLYNVTLIKTSWLIFDEVLDIDSTIVRAETESNIFSNATYPTGISSNVTVIFGFTPTELVDGLYLFYIDETGEEVRESITSIYNYLPITAGVPFDMVIIPRREGRYVLKLYNFQRGYVATASFESIFSQFPTTSNITTSYISVDSVNYQFGDVLKVVFGIDNNNFTNYKPVLELYNYDYSAVTLQLPLVKQASDLYGTIFEFAGIPGLCDLRTKECQIYALPGNNTFRLLAVNGSAQNVITFDNFTISKIDSEGYGLQVSTLKACVGDRVYFNATIPLPSNLTITNSDTRTIQTWYLNKTTTLSYIFKNADSYSVNLYKSGSSESKKFFLLEVNSCEATVTPTSAVPSSTAANEQMRNNLLNFMNVAAFWGLIIFGFIIGMTATATKIDPKSIGIVAFITANIEAVIGLWSPYTIYILAITWVIAGIFFIVGRNATE